MKNHGFRNHSSRKEGLGLAAFSRVEEIMEKNHILSCLFEICVFVSAHVHVQFVNLFFSILCQQFVIYVLFLIW